METSSIPTRFTLKDVADFCYENKRHKGFREHAYEQVAEHILWARNNGKLLLVCDAHGICGVCTFSVYPQRLYVHHIVCVRSGFASLVYYAKKDFPGYSIQGLRNSKLITFNQNKLWATLHHQQEVKQDKYSEHYRNMRRTP